MIPKKTNFVRNIQILLEKNTMLGNVMFIEKAENKKELISNLDIIIKSTKNKENFSKPKDCFKYIRSSH